jgi:hypothetical protein
MPRTVGAPSDGKPRRRAEFPHVATAAGTCGRPRRRRPETLTRFERAQGPSMPNSAAADEPPEGAEAEAVVATGWDAGACAAGAGGGAGGAEA